MKGYKNFIEVLVTSMQPRVSASNLVVKFLHKTDHFLSPIVTS